jgi:hypothetical protein
MSFCGQRLSPPSPPVSISLSHTRARAHTHTQVRGALARAQAALAKGTHYAAVARGRDDAGGGAAASPRLASLALPRVDWRLHHLVTVHTLSLSLYIYIYIYICIYIICMYREVKGCMEGGK